MLILASRGCAAALAVSLLIVAWLQTPSDSGRAADLESMLQRTATADSLQLTLVREGRKEELFVRHGKELRWNRPDGTYQIARDGKSWLVDEKANRANVQPSALFRGAAGKSRPAGLARSSRGRS